MSKETNGVEAEQKTYPTQPDSDGFFFDDDTNESMGIKSKVLENGNDVRLVKLSGNRVAIVNELTARQMGTDVQRMAGKNQDDVQYAMVAVATRIDDKSLTLEDVKEMKSKDYVRLQAANSQINF